VSSRTIVVGVDGSDASQHAVDWCADHAGALDARVVVVHAVDLPVYSQLSPGHISLSEADRIQLRDFIAADWCAPLRSAGIDHDVVLRDGRPATTIAHVADAEGAELVVVGRCGHRGLAELVLGSTTHELAHVVARPLLVVA